MIVNHNCGCGAVCCIGDCGLADDDDDDVQSVFEILEPTQNTPKQLNGFTDVWAGFNLFADIVSSI